MVIIDASYTGYLSVFNTSDLNGLYYKVQTTKPGYDPAFPILGQPGHPRRHD